MNALFLDTSAVLRAVLEAGTTPALEQRLRDAEVLITSRLSQVESARALHRLRHAGEVPEARLDGAEREIRDLWSRCELWELTPAVCELAGRVVPETALRTLDALHLATFVLARREISGLELLTADRRLAEAVERC
jgi:predicted nucleic acid-binding protein